MASRHRETNSPGYFTIAFGEYTISRVYSHTIELRGDFTNRSGTETYRDRMHSVPNESVHAVRPEWVTS